MPFQTLHRLPMSHRFDTSASSAFRLAGGAFPPAETAGPRVLALFPHRMREELARIESGELPTERFFGLVDVARRGWDIRVLDSRLEGRSGRIVRGLRPHGINLIDLETVAAIRRHDILIVKDAFSTAALLAARAARRPLIYMDALFELPRRRWKRSVARVNLRGAHRVVAWSSRQIDLWAGTLEVPREKFVHLPYTIDLDFYRARPAAEDRDRPFVLSVGRDLGRDFGTLIDALEGTGLHLKLVTLPYLVPEGAGRKPWVEILERISYETLFSLYSRAAMVVVPLKRGITYLSGLRGLLEGMALSRPLIVTRTPGLEEYAREDEVFFAEPEDPAHLRRLTTEIRGDPERAADQCRRAGIAVRSRYGMGAFVEGFEQVLRSV